MKLTDGLFSGFRMNVLPLFMKIRRYYDDYYYRDRAPAYYGREDPYARDNYYARDRNWYYQPDYRQQPYDR